MSRILPIPALSPALAALLGHSAPRALDRWIAATAPS